MYPIVFQEKSVGTGIQENISEKPYYGVSDSRKIFIMISRKNYKLFCLGGRKNAGFKDIDWVLLYPHH